MGSPNGESTRPPLSKKNYLNLVAYMLNVTLVNGLGNGGWLGTPNNGELSQKYQTLVTPKSSAFSIWGVIFLFQGAFAVAQLLPRFRARAMVLDGAGYWYPVISAVQISWTVAFAYEVIPLSLVFMLMLWCSLIAIVYSQYYTNPTKLCGSSGSCASPSRCTQAGSSPHRRSTLTCKLFLRAGLRMSNSQSPSSPLRCCTPCRCGFSSTFPGPTGRWRAY